MGNMLLGDLASKVISKGRGGFHSHRPQGGVAGVGVGSIGEHGWVLGGLEA